jgi:TetR/AcrR family transcriptional regulator
LPAPASPRSEASRDAILRAAVAEFSEQGPAGARMDAIARAAGVNKALLHYYFGTKEGLHQAVLDAIFGPVRDHALALLRGPGSAGERLLTYFLTHFDRLALGDTARLMAFEMMRAREGQPSNLPRLARILFTPVHQALARVFRDGLDAGELRPGDPDQVFKALTGINVFYFISAPAYREIDGEDPRDAAQVARQRGHMLGVAATLLFADPRGGDAAVRALLERFPQSILPAQGTRP